MDLDALQGLGGSDLRRTLARNGGQEIEVEEVDRDGLLDIDREDFKVRHLNATKLQEDEQLKLDQQQLKANLIQFEKDQQRKEKELGVIQKEHEKEQDKSTTKQRTLEKENAEIQRANGEQQQMMIQMQKQIEALKKSVTVVPNEGSLIILFKNAVELRDTETPRGTMEPQITAKLVLGDEPAMDMTN